MTKNRAPAYIPKYRRVMAVGCSHGDLASLEIQKQVVAFRDRYQPEIRFELGDVMDTAAFRSGARGTPDEGKPIDPDEFSATSWMERYEPTHITWGNHDQRLVEMQESKSAIVKKAAGTLWESLQKTARKLHAQTRPYDFEEGWFGMGGVFWGHGYWYNESAVRDHAEYLGGPCVIAHLHRALEEQGRTRFPSKSFCVGLLGDPKKMTYARRRRATSRWTHGVVWGEISDKKSHLWLSSCRPGETLPFPI